MKKILIALLTISVLGCSTNSADGELVVTEQCYDGVVYISERVGDGSLAIKFNRDGKVATETFNGLKCQ